jgi:hypothetical protein
MLSPVKKVVTQSRKVTKKSSQSKVTLLGAFAPLREKILRVLHRLHQTRQGVFRIAVEHAGHWFEKQRILET